MAEDPTGKTVTNPVQSRASSGPLTGLGLREFMDRPNDVPKPKPLFLRPFMSRALSFESYFGSSVT